MNIFNEVGDSDHDILSKVVTKGQTLHKKPKTNLRAKGSSPSLGQWHPWQYYQENWAAYQVIIDGSCGGCGPGKSLKAPLAEIHQQFEEALTESAPQRPVRDLPECYSVQH